ncbi:MAG: hypothetical protein ACR2LN_04690 [Candidatus Levyibacteriota bacterium]
MIDGGEDTGPSQAEVGSNKEKKPGLRLSRWVRGLRGNVDRQAAPVTPVVPSEPSPLSVESPAAPWLQLPRAGVSSGELLETPENQASPFVVVGLTDMEDFSLEGFSKKIDENNLIDLDDAMGSNMKYIVIRQENEDQPPADALFVFSEGVQHDRFLEQLTSIGYTGEAQSAGFLGLTTGATPSLLLSSSSSLDDKGVLSNSASNTYKINNLAKKLDADLV